MLKRSGARALRDAIFESLQLAFPSMAVDKDKTAIIDKLHYHPDHVPVRQESKERVGKAPMPYSVVCCCKVDKHSNGFLFIFKAVLNILTHTSDLF